MLANVLFDDVRDEMHDDGTRYTDTLLTRYLNKAIRAIITLVPVAGAETREFALVAGVKQSIPTDAARLIDLVCNVGGSTVSRISREEIDSYNPTWRQSNAVVTVEEFMYDPEQDPRTFYVSPPQPGTPGNVEAILSVFPASIADATTEDFPLSTEYLDAAIAHMVHLAHKAETGEGSNSDAALSYQTFLASLGLRSDGKA
jgi:hypothetical protein